MVRIPLSFQQWGNLMRFFVFLPLVLAACATTAPAPEAPVEPERRPIDAGAKCDAEPVKYHIGHPATQGMGGAMLTESGSRTLRWIPPRTAVTKDYRRDRLNVVYDDDMVITGVYCG